MPLHDSGAYMCRRQVQVSIVGVKTDRRMRFFCLLLLFPALSASLPETPVGAACDGCVPVFPPGLNGSHCYRIPSIIKSSRGTLLAFSENRISDCGDNGHQHNLVLRRSQDNGVSWGPLITVMVRAVPCPGCPAAISNPNPVEVRMADGTRKILLHYGAANRCHTFFRFNQSAAPLIFFIPV